MKSANLLAAVSLDVKKPWKAFTGRNWRKTLVGAKRVAVNRSEEYHDRAAECIALASIVSSEYDRLTLLNMAQSWLELAKQAVRNSQTDVWYETPPTRAPRKEAE